MISPTLTEAERERLAKMVDDMVLMNDWDTPCGEPGCKECGAARDWSLIASYLRSTPIEGWQTIESAPRDGRWLLGWWGDNRVESMRWTGREWAHYDGDTTVSLPTLWMPALRPTPRDEPTFQCGKCGAAGEFYEAWQLCEDCVKEVYGCCHLGKQGESNER